MPVCLVLYVAISVFYLLGLFLLNRRSHRHLTVVASAQIRKEESLTEAECKTGDLVSLHGNRQLQLKLNASVSGGEGSTRLPGVGGGCGAAGDS